jgi:hypothetical protein
MKTILHLGVAALLLAGCHRDGSMQREQKQYEVVQEGAASGVTSTINAPGETPAPITNTNADTTTAFAGFGNGAPMATTPAPGSLGGTLPPPDYSREGGSSAPPRPAPVARVQRPQQQREAPPPMTSAQPAPPPASEDHDTSTAPPPPPQQTDTTKTTTEAPEPEPEPQPEPQPPPPPPQPPTNT